MTGHVIISHGLQSSPEASKALALGDAAAALGWTVQRPDYRQLDAVGGPGTLGDVIGRIRFLAGLAAEASGPLVLAGSSMGAFISARVSLQLPVRGLFLMAPPVVLQGFDISLEAAPVPTQIIHGWNDELIPALDVVRWAQQRALPTVLVDDSHRLAAHVQLCADAFGRFLRGLS